MIRRLGYVAVVILLTLPAASGGASETGGVKPETTALYQKARDQVSGLDKTQATKYAREYIDQAAADIAAAQAGLERGDDRTTRQSSELATLRVKLAQAVTEMRIAGEQNKHAQAELVQFEQRLATILTGRGEQP